MNPDAFATDLARKPAVLSNLADTLAQDNPWSHIVPNDLRSEEHTS